MRLAQKGAVGLAGASVLALGLALGKRLLRALQQRGRTIQHGYSDWPGKWQGCRVVKVVLPPAEQQHERQHHEGQESQQAAVGNGSAVHSHDLGGPCAAAQVAAGSRRGVEEMTAVLLPWEDAAACEAAAAGLLPGLLPQLAAGVQGSIKRSYSAAPCAGAADGAAAASGCSMAAVLAALPVLGVDAEWEPESKAHPHNRVSVLQVCGASGRVLLLRPDLLTRTALQQQGQQHVTCQLQQDACDEDQVRHDHGQQPHAHARGLPPSLVRLLSDPSLIKAGVGIRGDCARLARDFGVTVRGAVDLRVVARAVAPDALVARTQGAGAGLAGLASALLGRVVDKAQQCSHWGREVLSGAQVAYAAQDAWVSRQLLLELFARHLAAQQAGATPQQSTADPAGLHAQFMSFVAPFVDQHHTQQQQPQPRAAPSLRLGPAVPGSSSGSAEGGSGLSREGSAGAGAGSAWSAHIRKPARHALRKKQLYENCRLMAPDGAVLCTCSTKKVRWYLDRGLAVLECEEPLSVRLKFEPRGRGNVDDAYYTSDKENRCVVCGMTTERPEGSGDAQAGAAAAATPAAVSTPLPAALEAGGAGAGLDAGTGGLPPPASEAYLRHSIVPHCYRKCFPLSYKSHLSHDIVLMCLPCHQVCSVYDQQRMAELGQLYSAPLQQDNQKYCHDQDVATVRSAARALTNPKVAIPAARRVELQRVVAAHFGVPDAVPSAAQLAEAGALDPRKPATEWAPHAERVVAALGEGSEAIQRFVQGWRQHFLDKMQPRYLPPYWSVDSRVANSTAHKIGDDDDGVLASVDGGEGGQASEDTDGLPE